MYDIAKTISALCSFVMLISGIKIAYPGEYDMTSKVSILGESLTSEYIKTRTSGVRLRFLGESKIFNNLNSKLDIQADIQSGNAQSVFIDEKVPNQNLKLNEAVLELTFLQENLIFDFGAINQSTFNSPLLIGNTAFIGSRQMALMEGLQYFIKIEALQTLANNHSQSQRYNGIDEGAPTYFQERVYLGYDANKSTRIETYVGKFAYDSLTNSLANISRYMGNSVSGLRDGSRFKYRFNGWNSGVNMVFNRNNSIEYIIRGDYIFNEYAPETKNTGLLYSLGFNFYTLAKSKYNLEIIKFRNESDSSVAFYNSGDYFHNNMEGLATKVSVVKDKIFIDAMYSYGNVIDKSIFQKDSNLFFVQIGRQI